jgi:hypothetical protein
MSLSFDVAALARPKLPGVRNRQSPEPECDPGLVPPGPARQPAVLPKIPVPPYDRELPESYWQKLQFRKLKNAPPVARASWAWYQLRTSRRYSEDRQIILLESGEEPPDINIPLRFSQKRINKVIAEKVAMRPENNGVVRHFTREIRDKLNNT